MKKLCDIKDILPETGVCALMGDKQVAIFRTRDDRLFAIDNHDPFSQANVLSRGLVGGVSLEGEQVLYVASPIYKQRFNLATGECLDDSSVQLSCYDVSLQDGGVFLRDNCG